MRFPFVSPRLSRRRFIRSCACSNRPRLSETRRQRRSPQINGSRNHFMPDATTEFDLQPDPRILPMLGEINLAQWKCLAELIENSIDAFLEMTRSGNPPQNPEVVISIPTIDAPSAKVVVQDNGPGMTIEKLERAVRAGWSGSDPTSNLGLFGMGFNIATARLGIVTTVWTTRAGDTEWVGLKIDFEALRTQRHFRTPRLTRPKN